MTKILLILVIGGFVLGGFGGIVTSYSENSCLINGNKCNNPNGYALIADFTISRVIEVDINGSIIWEYDEMDTPIDVERLDNGNTLITESYGLERIIEVDREGNVIWEYRREVSPFHPADSERLENGNTLITYGRLNQRSIIEVDINGFIVWEYNCTGLFYSGDLERLENGNTLMIVHLTEDDARVIEVNKEGDKVWEYVGMNIPNDAERLDNGNTLISTNIGEVFEVLYDGTVVWDFKGANEPIDIERLDNGNTLLTDNGEKRVIEIDSDGNVVWEYDTLDNPTDAEIISYKPLNERPVVEIMNPKEGYFHLSGKPIIPTFFNFISDTLSFGGFRLYPIIINATDDIDTSENLTVHVYLNGKYQGNAIYCCDWRLHEWFWKGWALGTHNLTITAEDSYGAIGSAEMDIWNFCFLP